MDSDDKFVARRGSQGDDWRWESDAPPEPAEAASHTARGVLAAIGGWMDSLWTAFRGLMNRPYQAPPAPLDAGGRIDIEAPQPAASPAETPSEGTGVPAATLKPPSGAAQAAADTGTPPPPPAGKPRTLGSVIRWSRIFPRERSSRGKDAAPWSQVAGERPKAALALPRPADVPTDSTSLLMFLAAAGLAAAIVIGVIVGVAVLGDEDGGGTVLPVTQTPKATLVGPETETPRPTASESPTAPATATPASSGTPLPSPTPAPTVTRTQAPAPTAAPATPPPPQGAVSLAMWANKAGAWWFGGMSGAQAAYEEGQTVPLLLKWNGSAGQTYSVRLTYDCAVSGAAGAIDYISGIEDWGQAVVFAAHGPAKGQPDAAVLSPNISGFTPDDGNSGVISLYGGSFTVLPEEPSPGGACPGRRTVTLSVRADGGPVSILASGHLGLSSAHSAGASRASAAMSVLGSVDGAGAASASIDPSAVSDAAR